MPFNLFTKLFWKPLQISILCLFVSLSAWVVPPQAIAAIQIKLTDISYNSCPPEIASNMVLGGGVMSASCYLVTGKATNPKNQTVYNADVFGRIYDANGNDAMPERTRVGAIAEIPPGTSDFEITISIPADMQEPISLKQFKASGFTGKVRR